MPSMPPSLTPVPPETAIQTQPTRTNNFALRLTIAVLAFFGFADSTYLAAEHFLGRIPPCTIVHGCQQVTTSSYAVFFGVPVALFGSIFYLTVLVLAIHSIQSPSKQLDKILFALGILGFLASARFVYIQLFILHAICIYCMASAGTSTGVFGVSLYVWSKDRTVKS